MMKKTILLGIALAAVQARAAGNDWDRLIEGGRFMDRILPMQGSVMSSDCWGAPGTRPRLVDNGIESADTSFWGGNILKGPDGLYHLNVAGWPESSPKGHNTWSQSDTYHAVSENPWGPFRVTATLGKGHNPETYRAKDGRYVCYVIDARYVSDGIAGPWEKGTFDFDTRDRKILSGLSNMTFATRQDGSMLAIDRGGSVWVSADGISAYRQIADHSVYSGNKRYFEDPVVWRDSLQYHMIVNDWNARIAYYSRSLDGLHWVTEQGEAYLPGCSVHGDGTVEQWYKYERAKVYLDETGRAAQINFAVIDTIKNEDKANDNHSSKNITMPLNRGMLLEVVDREPAALSAGVVHVLVKAEPGFDPAAELDLGSLVFGSYSMVNYGRGCRVSASERRPDGLLLTFSGDGGIDEAEFAPKMIGRDRQGRMVYGYARLPWVNYRPAVLSALRPTGDGSRITAVAVENFGLSASGPATVAVTDGRGTLLARGRVEPVEPYGRLDVALEPLADIPEGTTGYTVTISDEGGRKIDDNVFGIDDVVEARSELRQLVDSAAAMLADPAWPKGREGMEEALRAARQCLGSFSPEALAGAVGAMKAAINAFGFANASAESPRQVGLENPDMAAMDGWTVLDPGSTPTFGLNTNHDYGPLVRPFMEIWVSASRPLGVENGVSQTVGGCPAGRYRLTAAVEATRQNRAGDVSGVTLFINDKGVACHTANNAPETYTVDYDMAEAGDVTVGLHIDATTDANWVAWDNVRLEYLGLPAASAVDAATAGSRRADGQVYTLGGVAVGRPGSGLGSLPRGVYVAGGRKVLK